MQWMYCGKANDKGASVGFGTRSTSAQESGEEEDKLSERVGLTAKSLLTKAKGKGIWKDISGSCAYTCCWDEVPVNMFASHVLSSYSNWQDKIALSDT